MSKPTVQFNDYISLVVMLLMFVALVAGQADASGSAIERHAPVGAYAIEGKRMSIDFDGRLSDQALHISVAIVTDLNSLRGEDQ